MAKELEYKLQLIDPQQLEQILDCSLVREYLTQELRQIPMETTYYDNEEQDFTLRHWTLRHRIEGQEQVLCLKTPSDDPHARNEFQITAPGLSPEGIAALIEEGAPRELEELYSKAQVFPICGAKFLRRCGMLRFPDGSKAELALDQGELFGAKGKLPILELELELYEGDPTHMIVFARVLCHSFGLQEQPKSKFARARTLR